MQNTYGILDQDNCHIDVSNSERGAKRYATIHGYTKVSKRFNCGYHVQQIAEKRGSKWVKIS